MRQASAAQANSEHLLFECVLALGVCMMTQATVLTLPILHLSRAAYVQFPDPCKQNVPGVIGCQNGGQCAPCNDGSNVYCTCVLTTYIGEKCEVRVGGVCQFVSEAVYAMTCSGCSPVGLLCCSCACAPKRVGAWQK